MLTGPGRCRRRPGGAVRCLVSACLLSLLLYLPEARASYQPQSGECKGKGKECSETRAKKALAVTEKQNKMAFGTLVEAAGCCVRGLQGKLSLTETSSIFR
ncbi:hypothetical protein CHARACLAT_011025 [Characodon lateralis]|uniref:Uncharacterized protein n=1 Tax=Characodon lateralis TaxID=208331 RepID=A0ABU7ETW9_9TELE|nr:hypothetical protein [Characodon lateralis]